jgi:hypothetical protein
MLVVLQQFSDDEDKIKLDNITIKTLERLATATGMKLHISFEPVSTIEPTRS